MRRVLITALLVLSSAALQACASAPPVDGSTPPTPTSAAVDVCPLVDPGPPPVCPDGCDWNGTECRKKSGIIIHDQDVRDAGAPPPPTTN